MMFMSPKVRMAKRMSVFLTTLTLSMFRLQSKEIFEEWKLRLFNRRPFRINDRICERHFTNDQILTHWEHIIDGKLVQLQREKPRLKDNAIPQLNLEVRHAHTKRTRAPKKLAVVSIEMQLSVDDASATSDPMDLSNDGDLENFPEMPTSDDEVLDVSIEKLNAAGCGTREENDETSEAESKRKIFETIYDDIYEVVLPSTLWGIHRDPDQKFIAFTQFDSLKMNCSRALFVSNAFEIRATIGGADVLTETADVLTVQFLSKALSELDEQQGGSTSPKS